MARPKQPTDPVKTFEAGKRGVQTLYRAMLSEDPRIQLAAARLAHAASTELPAAIDEELRRAGTAARAGATVKRQHQMMG